MNWCTNPLVPTTNICGSGRSPCTTTLASRKWRVASPIGLSSASNLPESPMSQAPDPSLERTSNGLARAALPVIIRLAGQAKHITPEVIRNIVALIPDAWLTGESAFSSNGEHREAYVRYLVRRLEAPRLFSRLASSHVGSALTGSLRPEETQQLTQPCRGRRGRDDVRRASESFAAGKDTAGETSHAHRATAEFIVSATCRPRPDYCCR